MNQQITEEEAFLSDITKTKQFTVEKVCQMYSEVVNALNTIKTQAFDDAKEQDLCGKEGKPKNRYLDPKVQALYESHFWAYLQDLRGEYPVYHGNEWNA